MNTEQLFNEMRQVVQNEPEKFFMNRINYDGVHYVVFDYSLVIPSHFASSAAFECRGSVFEVDEEGNFIRMACRPYEKFLNLHEYDYDNNQPLFDAVQEKYGVQIQGSEDIKSLKVKYALNKEDGSIISSFLHKGELDLKSNSSLTSDYKKIAFEVLKKDSDKYNTTKRLTEQGYTVNFEYVSDYWKHRIVIRYDNTDLIVTGVRHIESGEYMTHNEMVSHFGEEAVVKTVSEWDWDDVETKEDIEGYVVVFECGLRCKLKTRWYVDLHKVKSNMLSSPRHFWEMYVNGEIDDLYLTVKDDEGMLHYFNVMLEKCDELYEEILRDGHRFYNENKDLGTVEFFKTVNSVNFKNDLSKTVAIQLYNGATEGEMISYLKEKLLVRKNISRMGIIDWDIS